MGYPKSLEEYTDEQIVNELERRAAAIRAGQCTYCDRPQDAEVCRFAERHVPRRTHEVKPACVLTITGPSGCGKTVVADVFRRIALREGFDLTINEVQPTLPERQVEA